jgi:hypothetical protein
MRKIALLSVLFVACLIMQAGCEQFSPKGELGDVVAYKGEAVSRTAPAPMGAGFTGAAAEPASDVSEGAYEQKIIRSADIRIKVRSVGSASEKARKIVEELGGMVTNTSAYEDDAGNKAMRVTLKVPSEKLDEAMAKLADLGEVKEEDIRAKDVTEQYVDLEARLANSKRLEQRLIALLADSKAKLEDVIKIEKELGRVRENIESMQARKRYYDSRISMSTIEVVFYEPKGFGRGIFDPISGLLQRSLTAFTASIALLIVVVSAAVPWVALLITMAWLFLRALRMWLRHKRAMKAKREHK